MQVPLKLAVSLAALLLVAVLGCGPTGATPYEYTSRGSRGRSDDLSISGGNLKAHEGRPGVFFGTVKTPGGSERFSYLVVFKHGRAQSGVARFSQDSSSTCSGREGSANNTIVLNGETIQAKHQIQLDDMGNVATEVLEIGGKLVDVKAGRLFLIDLTARSPAYEQRDVEISVDISSLEFQQDMRSVAGKLLEALKSEITDEFWN